MTSAFAALLAHHFPDRPSRLPARLVISGAVLSTIAVLLIITTSSSMVMVAGVVVAPCGLFPLLIGGALWLAQRSKRGERDKAALAAGAYDRVEGAITEVIINGIKSHDAHHVRVHALDGRVIELLVRAEELEPTIATLREHAWGRGMVSANATLDLQPRVR